MQRSQVSLYVQRAACLDIHVLLTMLDWMCSVASRCALLYASPDYAEPCLAHGLELLFLLHTMGLAQDTARLLPTQKYAVDESCTFFWKSDLKASGK